MSAEENKPPFEEGEVTAHELSHYNNRLMDLLRGAEWPSDKGHVYIMYALLRLLFLSGLTLRQVYSMIDTTWKAVVDLAVGPNSIPKDERNDH